MANQITEPTSRVQRHYKLTIFSWCLVGLICILLCTCISQVHFLSLGQSAYQLPHVSPVASGNTLSHKHLQSMHQPSRLIVHVGHSTISPQPQGTQANPDLVPLRPFRQSVSTHIFPAHTVQGKDVLQTRQSAGTGSEGPFPTPVPSATAASLSFPLPLTSPTANATQIPLLSTTPEAITSLPASSSLTAEATFSVSATPIGGDATPEATQPVDSTKDTQQNLPRAGNPVSGNATLMQPEPTPPLLVIPAQKKLVASPSALSSAPKK